MVSVKLALILKTGGVHQFFYRNLSHKMANKKSRYSDEKRKTDLTNSAIKYTQPIASD